jgi:thiamine biosynthesis lipoprotein
MKGFEVVKVYTKVFVSLLILVLVSSFLTACNSASGKAGNPNVDPNANKVTESKEVAMGTLISQKIYGTNGQVAIDEVLQRITYLETLLTFNASEGDIYSLNQNAGKEKVELNPVTLKVLRKSQQVAEISNGAFDITIGPLVKSWGIGAGFKGEPSTTELQKALALINYNDLEIDDHSARLKKPGQMVDLGGIAKGYIGDEVIEIYKKNGIKSGFVNLGGNVVTLGSKPDGSPWTVGIQHPRKEEVSDEHQILGSVSVRNKAVVTAGDGQRYAIEDGKRYHHILDPVTGYPAESGLMSVTLIMDSSFDADALDTAVFVLGLEKGMDLIKKYGGIEAIFITTDKEIIITDGLKGNFKLLEGNHGFELSQ